ncbi:MAG: hypothetical protein AAF997_02660 [Myxococcota bacterium]
MRGLSSRTVIVAGIVLCVGVAVVLFLNRGRDVPRVAEPDRASSASASKPAPRRMVPRDEDEPELEVPPGSVIQAPYFDLANLDFDALRARTPRNLYWLMAAPTDDPEVLDARRQEKVRRNEQYGRVLSSSAPTAEIEDYFAYRRKLSEDYIEVSQLILDEHGDDLAERDVGLLELTIALHASRLGEIPSKLDDALRRKQEYDQVKRAWQAQRDAERENLVGDTTNSQD